MRRWLAVFALLSLITTGFHSAATPAPAAAALNCHDSGTSTTDVVRIQEWTGFTFAETTSLCRDLNIYMLWSINDYPANKNCWVYIEAWYMVWDSPTEARWVEGAASGFWVQWNPGVWRTPLTNLADGTPIAWRFYPLCTGVITVRAAY